MEKKFTVVEWFVKELYEGNEIFGVSDELFEQAKEMEKEQVCNFANWCRIHENLNKNKVFTIQQLFDKYYTETFKSE